MADPKIKKQLDKLINEGSELAGGAVGGALGFLAGDPIGAAVLGAGGVMASKALSHIGKDFSERVLGIREKTRIGAALALAAEEINQRIKKNEKIRSDNFFDPKDTGRSDAEELAESILLKSQKEAEEKKIPFMAHLLANVAFSPEITVALGEQMIKATEQLTYRQLCLLQLAATKQKFTLRKTDYRGSNSFPRELYQLLHECHDLYHRGFINFGNSAALTMIDTNPSAMMVQGLGVDLYNWLQLWLIPIDDIKPLADVLSDKKTETG